MDRVIIISKSFFHTFGKKQINIYSGCQGYHITLICITEEFITQWQKKSKRSSTCFENITDINREQCIEVITTQSQSNFLLQSQIVYYCFVDCVTKENLISLLMSDLNQYESLKRITRHYLC